MMFLMTYKYIDIYTRIAAYNENAWLSQKMPLFATTWSEFNPTMGQLGPVSSTIGKGFRMPMNDLVDGYCLESRCIYYIPVCLSASVCASKPLVSGLFLSP